MPTDAIPGSGCTGGPKQFRAPETPSSVKTSLSQTGQPMANHPRAPLRMPADGARSAVAPVGQWVPCRGMSVSALSRLLRRRRHHLAVLAVVLAVGGTVAVHHAALADMGMGGAMVVCLAVLPAVAVAAAHVVRALLRRPLSVSLLPWPPHRGEVSPPHPRARSSPVATVVLRR
jgi:hypothetical protein